MRRFIWSVVLVLMGVVPAHAQELASSFDQLRVLVKAGDALVVTDSSGREIRGHVSALTSTSLEMAVAGSLLTLDEQDVVTVRHRGQDPLGNGAKTGFGIGFGFGLWGGLAFASDYGAGVNVVVSLALGYGAFGAGIGVAVDALIPTTRVLFSRPRSQSARLRVLPLVGRGRRGARLVLAF